MIDLKLDVPEDPDFSWLFENAEGVGDAVWIARSPMPSIADWPVVHRVDDYVGARFDTDDQSDPVPAKSGPRIITGDWNRATLTCIFPVEFASHGVHGMPPGKDHRDVVVSVAAAFEFGLGSAEHLTRGNELAARSLGFFSPPEVLQFVVEHGGPEGVAHYADDVVLLARGGDHSYSTTDRTVHWTSGHEEELEEQLRLTHALLDSQVAALNAALESEGVPREEILRRISDATTWSRERILRVVDAEKAE